jgi:hypothetical protein
LMVLVPGFGCLMCRSGGSFFSCAIQGRQQGLASCVRTLYDIIP